MRVGLRRLSIFKAVVATALAVGFPSLAGPSLSAQQAKSPDCARADAIVADAVETKIARTAENLPRLAAIYKDAIALCSSHATALNNLGDTYERMGLKDEAILIYMRAADAYRVAGAEPRFTAVALFGVADVYVKKGQPDDALYWYRKGLELDPTDAQSLASVAELTKADPAELVVSRSILSVLEQTRGPGVVAASLAFGERVLPFAYDSAELMPASRAQVREIAYALFDLLGASRSMGVLSAGPVIAELVGHADSRGSNEYNNDLARRRAQAVARALATEFRIPESRLRVTSHGKMQPLCREATEACYARNRRVEIKRL